MVKEKGGEKMEVIEVKQKLYRDVCPVCGKDITSQYKSQFDFNFRTHVDSCKRRNPSEVAK